MKFLFIFFLILACAKENDLRSFYPHLKWAQIFKDQEAIIDKEFQQKNILAQKIDFSGNFKNHFLITEMIVNVDSEKASKIFKDKLVQIKNLYSLQSSCVVNQLDPPLIENRNQQSMQFNLQASQRLLLGNCEEEQNNFHVQNLLIYCKRINTFYEIKYFYPRKEQVLRESIASCS